MSRYNWPLQVWPEEDESGKLVYFFGRFPSLKHGPFDSREAATEASLTEPEHLISVSLEAESQGG